jgi:predicted N-formylglutamate amidohydrolase
VYNTYGPGRKWDYTLKCWVEETPVANTLVETFDPLVEEEITHAELEKGLEPLLGESDEEYEARTDLLLAKYYAQFDDTDKSLMWD